MKRIENKSFTAAIGAMAVGIAVIPASLYFTKINGNFSMDGQDWANFRNYYGGTVAALFGAVNFIILYFTLIGQRRQLALSHEDARAAALFKMLEYFEARIQSLLCTSTTFSVVHGDGQVGSILLGELFLTGTNKVSRNDNEKDKAQLLSLADLLHNTASIAKQIAEVSERYNCVEDYIKHQYGAMLEQLRAHKYFPK